MNDETALRLLGINQDFYANFAAPFDATRQRLQPGVRRILESLPPTSNILDLGCGNGEAARFLTDQAHTGVYLGVDNSPGLLDRARQGTQPGVYFLQADLAAKDWGQSIMQLLEHLQKNQQLPRSPAPFDYVCAFAVLHHIPGAALRQQFLQQVRPLLARQGQLILSNWQFLNSERLRQRIQPWENVGLQAGAVDADDYLLDWRSGGQGWRYVHHFSDAELRLLAAANNYQVMQSFLSDGQTGNLGLYHVWQLIV